MTTEDIKRIVDDERVERLTAQLCRHWDVATERLEELVQDLPLFRISRPHQPDRIKHQYPTVGDGIDGTIDG